MQLIVSAEPAMSPLFILKMQCNLSKFVKSSFLFYNSILFKNYRCRWL